MQLFGIKFKLSITSKRQCDSLLFIILSDGINFRENKHGIYNITVKGIITYGIEMTGYDKLW